MKKFYFIANWKMKLSPEGSVELISETKKKLKKFQDQVEVIFCPSFLALSACAQALKGTKLHLGAQNVFWQDRGSCTGEVAPEDLVRVGCQYVILGHSERRKNLAETNEMVNKKLLACLRHKLIPIVCLGETLQERQEGKEALVLEKQVQECFKNIVLESDQQLIVCYEPVWAISDNLGAREITIDDVEQMTQMIIQNLSEVVSVDFLEKNFHFIYGGSVDSSNLNNFLLVDKIEGGLVGAASLKAEEIIAMVKILANQ